MVGKICIPNVIFSSIILCYLDSTMPAMIALEPTDVPVNCWPSITQHLSRIREIAGNERAICSDLIRADVSCEETSTSTWRQKEEAGDLDLGSRIRWMQSQIPRDSWEAREGQIRSVQTMYDQYTAKCSHPYIVVFMAINNAYNLPIIYL